MHHQVSKPRIRSRSFLTQEATYVERPQQGSRYFFWKRVLDVCLVVSALPIILPVVAIIAILIKLDSDGPVFFRQERVGSTRRDRTGGVQWQQRNFELIKFRTMVPNASSSLHQSFVAAYIAGDEAEMARIQQRSSTTVNKYKLERDPRITRVGHWLRKTSLDELPQVWNVLSGEMSLVGPRPAIPYEIEMYEPWHNQRLETVQGLTGFWQTSGRNSISFDDMVKLDIDYIQRQTIWLDLWILLMTLPTVLLRKGAE